MYLMHIFQVTRRSTDIFFWVMEARVKGGWWPVFSEFSLVAHCGTEIHLLILASNGKPKSCDRRSANGARKLLQSDTAQTHDASQKRSKIREGNWHQRYIQVCHHITVVENHSKKSHFTILRAKRATLFATWKFKKFTKFIKFTKKTSNSLKSSDSLISGNSLKSSNSQKSSNSLKSSDSLNHQTN